MKQLKDRLKEVREASNLSQEELAARAKIRQSFIGALESGAQKASGYLPEIANALGVNAYWLKTGFGKKHPRAELTAEEEIILAGFALLEQETKDDWLSAAKRRIDKASEKTKVA